MSATTAEAGAGGARLWLMDSPLLPYDDDTPGVASTEKPAYGLCRMVSATKQSLHASAQRSGCFARSGGEVVHARQAHGDPCVSA